MLLASTDPRAKFVSREFLFIKDFYGPLNKNFREMISLSIVMCSFIDYGFLIIQDLRSKYFENSRAANSLGLHPPPPLPPSPQAFVRHCHLVGPGGGVRKPLPGSGAFFIFKNATLIFVKNFPCLRVMFNSGWITYSKSHARTGKEDVINFAKHLYIDSI